MEELERRTHIPKKEWKVWKPSLAPERGRTKRPILSGEENKRHVRVGFRSEASAPAPSPGKLRGSATSMSGGG